jgi:hypothetical protein
MPEPDDVSNVVDTRRQKRMIFLARSGKRRTGSKKIVSLRNRTLNYQTGPTMPLYEYISVLNSTFEPPSINN